MRHFYLFRKFQRLQKLKAYCLFLLAIFAFSSCEDALRLSGELPNDPEGGDSEYPTSLLLGVNISYNFFLRAIAAGVNTEKKYGKEDGLEFSNSSVYSPYTSYREYQDARKAEESQKGGLGLYTGLEFVQKGFSSSFGNNGKIKTRFDYLEVPVYGMYAYPLADGGALYGGLGPYVAYGIAGNSKSDGYSTPSFGENNGGFKRFDAGLGIIGGYRFNFGLSVDLSYELGLVNNAYASSDITAHNRAFSVNVGYSLIKLFRGMKK